MTGYDEQLAQELSDMAQQIDHLEQALSDSDITAAQVLVGIISERIVGTIYETRFQNLKEQTQQLVAKREQQLALYQEQLSEGLVRELPDLFVL